MALAPGTRLGPYEIQAPLGAGGMGEVYRARDSKLHRHVALKILPDAFSSDPERVARFEREARTLASLNHPQIAQIYGFEQSGATSALVMELVEGEDLAQRLTRRALPIDDALATARQIADALEAAHEQGIIHRDLKPANIKVRPDGAVKVLDFGLAKALDPAGEASGAGREGHDVLNSPTITSPAMTLRGMILGTAAYMAPEQAKGKPVDKRADIWAFGCVLYEMLTGTRAFPGEDVTDTLAFVITKEPDWAALPASTPQTIKKLLRRCVEKDRKRRLADIADARFEIEEAIAGAAAAPEAAPPSRKARARVVATAAIAALACGIAGALIARQFGPAPARTVVRFSITLPEGQQFRGAGRTVAISPDGSLMLLMTNAGLLAKPLGSFDARIIPGTEASQGVLNPAFSPDGQAIAFWSARDQTIKTIATAGGTALTVGPAVREASSVFSGLSWHANGILVAQGTGGIVRMSRSGAAVEKIVTVAEGESANSPEMLPDGEHILFTVVTGTNAPRWSNGQIVAQSLQSGKRTVLVERGSDARYLPTGHLIYAADGVVYAVGLDVRRLVVTGQPTPVVEGVRRASVSNATSQFSVSQTGTLMYLPGPTNSSNAFLDLARFDRQRRIEPLKLPPGPYEALRISPDGTRVAFSSDDGSDANVWVYELSGKSAIRRLTFGGRNRFPVWSADGQRIAFQSNREGDTAVFVQRADVSGTAERLTKPEPGTAHTPEAWSRSGHLLYTVTKAREITLWSLAPATRRAEPFGNVRSFTPTSAAFSPDGRWVAYATTEAGRPSSTVFVQPLPATGATYQISRDDDGHHPVWSADGRELSYVPGPGRVVAVNITTNPTFSFTAPQDLPPPGVMGPPTLIRNHDITRDGSAFIGLAAAAGPGAAMSSTIHIVLNWFAELNARVPVR